MNQIDLSPDVLVVGGGIAGALAAARAREGGARVVLVHRPGGGTALSSGAIDVADELTGLVPGQALDALERGARWRRAIELVAAQRPRHPYARALDKGRERLREILHLLRDVASDADLTERDDGTNHVVATQLGTIKRATLVQRSQLLDLAALPLDAVVGVVEPADLSGFSARSVTHMLSWVLGLGPDKLVGRGRPQFTPVLVARTLSGTAVHGSTLEMAAHLDDPNARTAFLQALHVAVREHPRSPTHLLFPAIFGIAQTSVVATDIETACGRPARELMAMTPSAPGARLQRALLAGVNRRVVPVVEASAIASTVVQGRATSVTIEGRRLRAELTPRAVVLAGGRFLGGGIVRDHVAREPLFGLPVITGGSAIGDSFIGDHLDERPEGEHAIFRAGVAVDDQMRPVDHSGRVLLDNVSCAGMLVEGWDPARDGTAGGVAALSGFLAGDTAARTVRRGRDGEAA